MFIIPAQELLSPSSASFGNASSPFPGKRRKKQRKWGRGMFASSMPHRQGLAPVDEIVYSSSPTASLRRARATSTDSESLHALSPVLGELVYPIEDSNKDITNTMTHKIDRLDEQANGVLEGGSELQRICEASKMKEMEMREAVGMNGGLRVNESEVMWQE